MSAPIRIPVHYDFASCLCYVAHRAMQRLAPELAALEIELAWTPVDLSSLCARRRGEPLPDHARANVERVSRELDVPLHLPDVWGDSRAAHAAALVAERTGRGAVFRETVFAALYEQGRTLDDGEATLSLARGAGVPVDATALDRGRDELRVRTEEARALGVTGVPSFQLGAWPCAGIQIDDTMRQIFRRFAARARSADAHRAG